MLNRSRHLPRMPKNYAESIGGHLATSGTREERNFVFTSIVNAQWLWFSTSGPLIGVIQDHSAPDFAEPAAGWRWIYETPWTWNPWKDVPAPNGTCEMADECVLRFANPNCDASPSGWCDDSPLFLVCPGCDGELSMRFAIVEFEIDCDGNGLVNFGEKLADLTLHADQDGDLDGDGIVTGSDVVILLGKWCFCQSCLVC